MEKQRPDTVVRPEGDGDGDGDEHAVAAPEATRPATFRDYLRVFSYARPWDLPLMAAAAVAAAGAGVTLPLMNVVFGRLVGDFNDYFSPEPRQDQASFERSLDRNALYIFLLFLVRFGLAYVSKLSFRMIGIRMSAAIRLHYLRSLFGQTMHVLDSMEPGAAAGTISTTANTLQLGISEKLGTLVEFTCVMVAAMAVAFATSWALALVTASVVVFILCVVAVLLPLITKGQAMMAKAEAQSSAVASEAFAAIRMVMACGAESRVCQRFAVLAEAARRHGQATAPLLALQMGLIFFGLYASFGLAFWYGTKSYSDGRIDSAGDIVVVLMSVMLMVLAMERISSPLVAVGKAMVAACDFFVVIDAPRPRLGELEVSADHDLELEGVDFAYPSRPHVKVLDGLDLTIEAGKVTAIVGPSGSGKSTIVGLIERWYSLSGQHVVAKTVPPTHKKKKRRSKDKQEAGNVSAEAIAEDPGPPVPLKGTITTAGHRLDEINVRWWRSQIGLVQQEPFLFNDSIYNNVAFGLIGSAWEKESEAKKRQLVMQACDDAFASEFIDRLPDGYDTMVGDSGQKLSGGQRQRISIARAVIKKPKMLILDEATSAIDVRGERIVQAALDKVSQGRTTVTIAHRLSTIKKADRIVVLRKGKVVESGTHESLLQNEAGVYSGLVHAQQLILADPSRGGDELESDEAEPVLEGEKETEGREDEPARHTAGYQMQGLAGSFGRLLYEQKKRFGSYMITLVCAGVAAASSPMQAYLFAKIVVVFQQAAPAPLGDPARFRSEADFWSLMWVVLAISTGLAYWVVAYVTTRVAAYISSTYRKQYLDGLLHQHPAFFDADENSTGTLTARISSDPKQLEELLGLNMVMVLTSFFTIVGSLVLAFHFGWKLALVALCVTAPLGLLAGYYRFRYERQFDGMYAAVFAESSKFAAESIGAFRTVASMTLEQAIADRYETLLRSHVAKAFGKARWTTLVFALSDSVSLACQALIAWYGGRLLARREYDALTFFVCYMAVIQGAEAAGNGFSFGPNAAQASAAANRILSVRESGERTRDGGLEARQENRPMPDTQGGVRVEFRDVHFRYPTRNVPVFRRLNLVIEKGRFAGLVGASGCGKTSVIALLERFYDVGAGQITVNGVDVTRVDMQTYRRHLSLVAQEAGLLQGTLRDNILLGVAEPDTFPDEDLHAACRAASIHDFIVSLPEGYGTAVGSRGLALSGGQKQRVAIARAIVRRPALLLLDEATSSLDSESERLVQDSLETAAQGRTMLVVAHRLATVQKADVIFVLGAGGHVLEKGSHAELLERRGVYWQMCQSQALDR